MRIRIRIRNPANMSKKFWQVRALPWAGLTLPYPVKKCPFLTFLSKKFWPVRARRGLLIESVLFLTWTFSKTVLSVPYHLVEEVLASEGTLSPVGSPGARLNPPPHSHEKVPSSLPFFKEVLASEGTLSPEGIPCPVSFSPQSHEKVPLLLTIFSN